MKREIHALVHVSLVTFLAFPPRPQCNQRRSGLHVTRGLAAGIPGDYQGAFGPRDGYVQKAQTLAHRRHREHGRQHKHARDCSDADPWIPPAAFGDAGITAILAGLMALAFIGFTGVASA